MRRILSVIALSVALGLSTMGFKNPGNDTSCEASTDLSVAAELDNLEAGMGEVNGKIINSSSDNDYDEVLVKVEFFGADLTTDDGASDIDIDRERDIDVDVDEGDVDVDYESTPEIDADLDDTSLELRSNSLGSKVVTVNEDVAAGEVEEFALDITPPAGTTRITTTVICAD